MQQGDAMINLLLKECVQYSIYSVTLLRQLWLHHCGNRGFLLICMECDKFTKQNTFITSKSADEEPEHQLCKSLSFIHTLRNIQHPTIHNFFDINIYKHTEFLEGFGN